MIDKIKIILKNLPKTLYFNFKFLSFNEAIFLPIIVSNSVKINRKSTGKIRIIDKKSFYEIYIGFPCLKDSNENTVINIDGVVEIEGKAFVAAGVRINVEREGNLRLGENFNSTGRAEIICAKKIIFGRNCTISWDTLFMDTDSHSIYNSNNELVNKDKPILIGDNCWFGCRSIVLKGSRISNGNVIAANSMITKNHSECNVILAEKDRILKRNISWGLEKPGS